MLHRICLFLCVVSTIACLSSLCLRRPIHCTSPKPTEAPPAHCIKDDALFEASVGTEGRPLYLSAVVHGQQVRLLLDTGCSQSGLDSRFRSLLTAKGGVIPVETPAGTMMVDVFKCPSIVFGSLAVAAEGPIFCSDFTTTSRVAGEEFDGVLGMDILSQFIVQIDFDSGKVRFLDKLPTDQWLGSAIPIWYGACNRPQIRVGYGDASHRLIIATGSTNTCLVDEDFDLLAQAGTLQTGVTHSITTASGQVRTRPGLLRELSVGPFKHVDVLCDRGRLGLLGLRYLARFRVTFDFPSRTAYFCEGVRYAMSDPRGVTGIRPVQTSDGFVVRAVSPKGSAREAGVQSGDEILAVDGESTKRMDLFRIGQLLTSKPGHRLSLKLRRCGKTLEVRPVIKDRFAVTQASGFP